MNPPARISNCKSKIRRLCISLCLIFMAPRLPAQNPAAPSGTPIKIRVDVDLVTIEVYALDGRSGKPTSNLKKEDFRLYEDGKRQEILSFDVVDGTAEIPPSARPILDGGDMPRGKTVLIVFDENTIPSEKAALMRDSAARFVRERMHPRDLFAVASWNGTMRIIQNLTDDREAVLAAVAQGIRGRGWGPFEAMLLSLEQINHSIASIRGQKSVLIFGRPAAQWPQPGLADLYRRTVDSARKSDVMYSMVDPGTLAPGGLDPPDLSVVLSVPESGGIRATDPPAVKMRPASYSANSLVSDTGGFSVTDLAAVDVELDTLDRNISSYYILGFQSTNQKHEGAFRKIRVTTGAKGVTLKHKPGYQDRLPIDVLASSRQEQALVTALAAPGSVSQLSIDFRPAYFHDSSRPATILVAAKIRTEKIAFQKKAGQMSADLSIMGAAYAENGSIAARFSETLPVRCDKETECRKQELPYSNYFRLRPGRYRLKLAASDESGNLGSAEQSLEVPDLTLQSIACSSLVVAEQQSKLPELIRDLQTQMLGHDDPLLYSGTRIQPSVTNRLPVHRPVSVLFRICNLHGTPAQWDLEAKARLVHEGGAESTLSPLSLKQNISAVGKGEAAVYLTLPFPELPAGKYRLVIEITESVSSQISTIQTDIEFVDPDSSPIRPTAAKSSF